MWLTLRWPIKFMCRPGQRVVTIPTAPDNRWWHSLPALDNWWWHSVSPQTMGVHHLASTRAILEHFSSVHLLYGVWFKNVFCVNLDNGWQTQRATPDNGGGKLRATPDIGWQCSPLPRTACTLTLRRPRRSKSIKSSLPPPFMKFVFKKEDTISIPDVRLWQKRGVKSHACVPFNAVQLPKIKS